jgi:hypothetical protein
MTEHTLSPVDVRLLNRLRDVLPAGAKLDAQGPVGEVAAALLDMPVTAETTPLTVRVVTLDAATDVSALVAAAIPITLLLVGPVGSVTESATLRALALACDETDVQLTPFHMLHPSTHGSELAALTPGSGPAAAVVAALVDDLDTHDSFINLAHEANRLQFAIKEREIGVARAIRRAPPPPPMRQPGAPDLHPALTAPRPPGRLKRVYQRVVPMALRVRVRDAGRGAVGRARNIYRQTVPLEIRLLLRELLWRLRNWEKQ